MSEDVTMVPDVTRPYASTVTLLQVPGVTPVTSRSSDGLPATPLPEPMTMVPDGLVSVLGTKLPPVHTTRPGPPMPARETSFASSPTWRVPLVVIGPPPTVMPAVVAAMSTLVTDPPPSAASSSIWTLVPSVSGRWSASTTLILIPGPAVRPRSTTRRLSRLISWMIDALSSTTSFSVLTKRRNGCAPVTNVAMKGAPLLYCLLWTYLDWGSREKHVYVDVWYDAESDTVRATERYHGPRLPPQGKRVLRCFTPDWTIWAVDREPGHRRSIWGDPLTAIECSSRRSAQIERAKRNGGLVEFEADISPVMRVLEQHYANCETPTLNVLWFDIEVDVGDRGFAGPDDPHEPIVCIGTHLPWLGSSVTLLLAPPGRTADEIAEEIGDPTVVVFESEEELLTAFLEELVTDADVLSGWNSSGYDIPYIVNRLKLLGMKDKLPLLCIGGGEPIEKKVERFGRLSQTYDLIGRVHIDYLELYRKNKARQFHSYRLDFIGAQETGERKVPFDGSLGQLWRKDPATFARYNQQDVRLLTGIDRRCRFLDLANVTAHANCVPLTATLGTVVLVEQAVTREYHARRLCVPARGQSLDLGNGPPSSDAPVAGAWVVDPKRGVHEWVGSVDIQSLYPSTIRSFNISPETIVGQIDCSATMERVQKEIDEGRSAAEAMSSIFVVPELEKALHGVQGHTVVVWSRGFAPWLSPGRNEFDGPMFADMIRDPDVPICVSANGTLFRTDVEGVVPSLLSRWFAERKQMQARNKLWTVLATGSVTLPDDGEPVPADENEAVDVLAHGRGDGRRAAEILGLVGKDGRWVHPEPHVASEKARYWHEQQFIRKILLNSVYGALLNPHCRFFDPRLGQSVTLSGRCITRHMAAEINRTITGEYDPTGTAVIYGDTDSCYFSIETARRNGARLAPGFDIELSKDSVPKLHDRVAETVNASFPSFLAETFGVPRERCVIRAARELTGRGYFVKKKRYAVMAWEKEGKRLDLDGKPGEPKVMGFESRRSDTPEVVQDFLEDVLSLVLTGADADAIRERIEAFRAEFRQLPPWEKGPLRAVNNLADWTAKAEAAMRDRKGSLFGKIGGLALPGHVRAAIIWNTLRDLEGDTASVRVTDGMKCIICRLRPNPLGIRTIAFPTEQEFVPEWFRRLPFDEEQMECDMIERKVANVLAEFDMSDANIPTEDDIFVFEQ